jgi:tetratricopeptide (TPR) repeat protein
MTDFNNYNFEIEKIKGFVPNFLGIGVAKAGTTSVSNIIAQHPEISFSTIAGKEIHYFDEKFIEHSKEWYISLFEQNYAVGEWTPSYIFVPECRDRIYNTLGQNVKFIVSIRNPVDRAFSHFCHAINNWGDQRFRKQGYPVESLNFEDALDNEIWRLANGVYHIRHQSYFSKGLYARQLNWYFKKFSEENFYIYLLEDYARNPEHILTEICKFLNVDPNFKFKGTNEKLNSQTNRAINSKTRQRLSAKYYESIEELEDLLNRDLSLWKGMPRKSFSKNIRKNLSSKNNSVSPIFIVGSPRSGTTLLQCMLSVSDQTYSLPETHFFCTVLPSLKVHFNSKISSKDFQIINEKLKEKMELTWSQHLYEELNYKAANEELFAKDLFSEILEIFRPSYDSKKLLKPIEKTPFHVVHLNDILECYPNARFINMVRDVRDVVSSRILMPTAVYKSVIPYTDNWNHCIREVGEFAKEYPEKIICVRYEDLVLKTKPTLQKLCQFLGIDFVKEMVSEFNLQYENCTLHKKETWKEEVKTGEIKNKIGIWKERLHPERISVIEHIAGSEMENYGYKIEGSATKLRALDMLNKEVEFYKSERINHQKISTSGDNKINVEFFRTSEKLLSPYKDKHSGERCIIIGNGPSLNKMDLTFLKEEITFGMNKIYLLFDKWDFTPTYYVSVNPLVLEQSAEKISKISSTKFLSFKGQNFFKENNEIIFLKSVGTPSFSRDPHRGIWEGHTVTYVAMQLAFYMGFDEVILIGVDHSFNYSGNPNQEVVSKGKDINHFHPDYFGKGVRWNLPDLEKSEIAYQMAKKEFENNGRRIIDATVDGKLTIFPKCGYKQLFKKYLRIDGEMKKANCSELSSLRVKGDAQLNSAEINDALLTFNKILQINPKDACAHHNLGDIWYKKGDLNKALSHYEKASSFQPNNKNFRKKLAHFYYSSPGRTGDAIEHYCQIIESDPSDSDAHMILGHISVAIKKFDEAKIFFRRVLEIDPFNTVAQKQLNNLETIETPSPASESPEDLYKNAMAFVNKGQEDAAIRALDSLLKLFPDFAIAHNDIGVLFLNKGNKIKSLFHFYKATELQPENISFQKNLAEFYYFELNEIQEAMQIYTKILDSEPKDFETLLTLGLICEKLEKFEDAKDFYSRVLEIDPANKEARQRFDTIGNE